jgi:hypothetical protein
MLKPVKILTISPGTQTSALHNSGTILNVRQRKLGITVYLDCPHPIVYNGVDTGSVPKKNICMVNSNSFH